MAGPDSSLRSMAWSSVFLGAVLAVAHVAWFSLNPDTLGAPALDAAYLTLCVSAVLAWSLVVICGLRCLASGQPPHRRLAGFAAAAAAAAALTALVLLVVTASGSHADGAFDDVLLQSWPLLPLLLFVGDWVRRSRTPSLSTV